MKHATYHYRTEVHFSRPVHDHAFLLRCTPSSNEYQQMLSETCDVYPAGTSLCRGNDAFGNSLQSGTLIQAHDYFVAQSNGEISLANTYCLPDEKPMRVFLYPSEYTRESSRILRLFERAEIGEVSDTVTVSDTSPVSAKVARLCATVYEALEYAPATTNINTTADQALVLGRGVCQDFAHILITLCRHARILARYVAGFMEGEGATHAWVEYYEDGFWKAADPTHNRLIDTGYIKLSHGRDYGDCSIERGVFSGLAEQRLSVELLVNIQQ